MEKLITRKEAAKILGISIATLDTARQNGLISYVQYVPNGCVYFTDAALQEYVAKCTKRAKPADNNLTYRKQHRPKKEIACSSSQIRQLIPTFREVKEWQERKKRYPSMALWC